jgi:hypothetical protein
MEKITVAEAPQLVLDYLVAKIQGRTIRHDPMAFAHTANGGFWIWEDHPNAQSVFQRIGTDYSPTGDCAIGCPILDEALISTGPVFLDGKFDGWEAFSATLDSEEGDDPDRFYGPTRLIAGFRCYVASEVGDEVEVPKQLLDL